MKVFAPQTVFLLACTITSQTSFAKRGMTAEDYFAFEFVNDARIAPDGKQIAFVYTNLDQKRNRRNNSVWVVSTDGSSAPRRLTTEGANSNAPRWSPDGQKIAFLSSRGEGSRPQIFVLRLDGGEAQILTHLKNGVSGFQWSPDGKRLVAVSRSGPSDKVEPSERKSDVRHYFHISYKFNDTGWFDDKRTHLWVVDAVGGGDDKQITSGDDWNDSDPQWSPDGSRIAFVSDRTGKEYDGGHNKDVWTISPEGGPLVRISDHEFEDDSPRWSLDGQKIYFLGRTERRQFPRIYEAAAANPRGSSMVIENLDLIPQGLTVASPTELRFESGTRGQMHVFRVDLARRRFSPVTSGERAVRGFDVNAKTGAMAYFANDFRHLDDLYLANLDGSGERQLTHFNTKLWSEIERIRATAAL
jgi:dipeptidyl aminopeptidase/acylaminoacyl peptidase